MYIGYVRVDALPGAVVSNATVIAIPPRATHVEIQADQGNVRYTMDSVTNPTPAIGMLFIANADPKTFLIEDLVRIRFCRDAGVASLNLYFFAGRDV
jgi:hypothetical protein